MLNSLFLSAVTVFLTSSLSFHPALYFTSAHTPTTVTELMSSFGFMSSNSFLLHSYFILVQSLTSLKSQSLSCPYPPTVHLPQWFKPPTIILVPSVKKHSFIVPNTKNPFNICLWKCFFLSPQAFCDWKLSFSSDFMVPSPQITPQSYLLYSHLYSNTKNSSAFPSPNISALTLSHSSWKHTFVEIKNPQILYFLF